MADSQLIVTILFSAIVLLTKGFPIKENDELIYDFNGQVTTGIVKEVKQFSGFVIKGKVLLQNQEGVVYIKFFNLSFGETNGPLLASKQAVDEFDFVFKKPTETVSEFLGYLEKPFRATFENGIVKSFDTEAYDSYWSVNFKRAFLSLIQLNLKKYSKEKAHTYFRAEEDSIQGLCDTAYEVIPSVNRIVVTKIRHLDSCKNKPFLFFSNMIEAQCSEEKRDSVTKFSHVTYIVNTAVQNIIEKIVGTNFLGVTPFGNMGQSVLSKVNQQMTLLDLKKVEHRLELNLEFITYDSLKYTFNDELKDDDEGHYFDRLISIKYRDYFHRTEITFQAINDAIKNGNISPYFADDYDKFIRLLSAFTYEEFVQFSERHFGRTLCKASEEILANSLPMIGTSASVIFSLKWIKEQFYLSKSDSLIQQMLSKLPFYVKKPSKIMMEEFYKFLKNTAWNNSHLQQDAWLSFGTLINKACNYRNPVSGATYINKDDCSKFVKILTQKFHQTTNQENKMEFLKALINTRTTESFNLMLSVIKSNSYEISFRKLALQSAFSMEFAFNEFSQLIESCSHIVRNSSVDWSLKIYAYRHLLNFAMDQEHMTAILSSALNEPNRNIAVAVYEMAIGIMNSTTPCSKHLKEYIKKVLPTLLPPTANTILYSGNRIFSAYNVQYDYGRSDQFSWVGTNGFLIPQEFNYLQSIYILGYRLNPFELGFFTDEHFLDSDFAKFLLLHALALKNIKIPFTKNDFDSKNFKFKIHMRMFDQFVYSSEGLRTLLLKGTLPKTLMLSTFDLDYDLTNDMGFPISLQSRVNSLQVMLSSGAASQDKEEGDQGLFPHKFAIHYRDETKFNARMSVITPLDLSFGFELETEEFRQLPLEGFINFSEGNLSSDSMMIDWNFHISMEKTKLIGYKSMPFTFIKSLETISSHNKENSIKPIHFSNQPTENSMEFGQDYFGIGITLHRKQFTFENNEDSLRPLLLSVFNKRSHQDDDVYLMEDTYTLYNSLRDFVFLNPEFWQTEVVVTTQPNKNDPITEYKFNLKLNKWTKDESSDLIADDGHQYDLGIQEAEFTINGVHNNEVKKKWLLQLQISHLFPPKIFNNLHLNFMRTPLSNYDENPLIVSFDLKLNDKSRFFINKKNLKYARVEYLSKLELLNYGDQIVFKLVFEKSDEEKKILTTEKSMKVISKCENYWRRKIYDTFCWKKALEFLSLRRITADIQLQRNDGFNDPEYLKDYGVLAESFLRRYLNDSLDSTAFDLNYSIRRVRLEANMSYYQPTADTSIYWYSPNENEFILKDAEIPMLQPYLIHDTLQEKIFRNVFGINSHVVCRVSVNSILMFNGTELKPSFADIYQSVCRSCSNPELFKVSVRKKAEMLDFVIHTSHMKVEMSSVDSNYILKVNDQIENDPQTSRFRNLPANCSIYYHDGCYWFTFEDIGLQVTYDGNSVDILINNGYWDNVCGLCGNIGLSAKTEF